MSAQKGFSLVELLVVVAIVSILAAVAIPAYINHVYRSRQFDAAQVLMSIKAAQEIYRADVGGYSTAIGNLDGFTTAGTYYGRGDYRYSIASTVATTFTAVAEGDLNRDGQFFDRWLISDTLNQPQEWPVAGGDEGFGWSLLSEIFN